MCTTFTNVYAWGFRRQRKSDDPQFIKPFCPEDFGGDERKQVGVQRRVDAGFLFRIDPQQGGRVAILVQSAIRPDWDYAFANASFLLSSPPQVSDFDPLALCRNGAVWRFRLREPDEETRGETSRFADQARARGLVAA